MRIFSPIRFFLLIFFIISFFFVQPPDKTHAQACSPDDPNSCEGGLVCDELSFECAPPKIGSEGACKTNLNECVGDMSCIPDATGSEDGKCGVPAEGSLCNPANTQSCGASTFSPLSCDAASQSCKRTACDPARGSADCSKPSFSCVQEGDGAYCKFVSSSNRIINVRINYHDVVNVRDRYARNGIKVDLLRNGEVIKTSTSSNIESPGTGKNEYKDINEVKYVKFEDVVPGDYEVCVQEAGGCKDVKKDTVSPGQPDPVVFSVEGCAFDRNNNSNLCESVPPAPPPPCKFKDDGMCKAFDTGFGSLSTEPGKFISSIFGILLAASGAIALLLILRAGYKMMTSKGEPEKVKDAREQLIAAIVGLMFLIFALVFLELIGFGLLRLPGFAGSATSTTPIKTPINRDDESNPNDPNRPDNPGGNQRDPNGRQDPEIPSLTSCSKTLYQIGSSGGCVEQIQTFLDLNPADGIYDARTDGAARAYQAKQGIFPDGKTGPCTWGKFLGKNVRSVCAGALTDNTIRQFQDENNLIIDGSLNSCTWDAIMGDQIPSTCRR